MGKLIVIDGLDASGKQTQCELLFAAMKARGENVMKISFPNYDDPSSELVKMYLRGEFGNDPSDVNAYMASSFYAVDRCASYLKYWKSFYEGGGTVIADRYTTSNAIHQGVKLSPGERREYFDWLYEYEFGRLGLPKPDTVIFLDVLPEVSLKLMEGRKNKIDNSESRDIHEASKKYLFDCHEAALEAADRLGWIRVNCVREGQIRKIEDISREVIKIAAGTSGASAPSV
ncbi:MAG: thymidylate kinase [Clostridia bacterium]|nr:thymidylate kinase [Clostridia bacterium]MBQ4249328.1 thymidylate kinase [Clostridia bacterium]